MSVTLSLKSPGIAWGPRSSASTHPGSSTRTRSTWVERAFAEHPVLVFRDQRLGADELAAFGLVRCARSRTSSSRYRHEERVDVSYITNVDKHGGIDRFGVTRASTWHTDETYEDRLPRLAILHALEVPSTGGGTMFADMRAAHDLATRGGAAAARTGSSACTAAPTGPTASSSTARPTSARARRCARSGAIPPSSSTR